MSKFIQYLSQFKGYIFVALLPLALILIMQLTVVQLGVHGVPSPIHGLSAMILQHIFLFVLIHILLLLAVYVYLTRRIARITHRNVLSEAQLKKLLNLKFWFLGMVAVLECVFILQVFL